MALRKLEQYQTPTGKIPFREWLLALNDITTRARVRARLDRVQLGNYGDYKALSSDLFELRLHFGPGYRIYFGEQGDHLILLLCGGDKNSQKRDIKIAGEY